MSVVPSLVATQIATGAASAEASARKAALAPFLEAGAFGPGEAIDWTPGDKIGHDLVRTGVLKQLRPGRFYHDRQVEVGRHAGARKVMIVISGLLLLAGLVLAVTV